MRHRIHRQDPKEFVDIVPLELLLLVADTVTTSNHSFEYLIPPNGFYQVFFEPFQFANLKAANFAA